MPDYLSLSSALVDVFQQYYLFGALKKLCGSHTHRQYEIQFMVSED